MSNKKSVSIRNIAKMCNVSPSTVSRVINGSGRISEEKRNEILSAIEKTGYTISQNNKKIFSENIIGVLFPYATTYYHPHMISELTHEIRKKGYVPFIMFHENDTEIENTCINVLSELDIKGFIVIPANHVISKSLASFCKKIPTLFMDTIADEPYHTINSDQFSGGQLAALEFLNKGCRNPIIICRRDFSMVNNLRVNGFIDIFSKNGIKIAPSRILNCNRIKGSFSEAKDLIKYAFIKGLEFDCVFADSDWKAFGCLVALEELGFKIPEDIKIIGYDYSDITRYTYLPITSISQNVDDYADKVIQILFSLIDHDTAKTERETIIPVSLKVGKTT